MRAGAPDLLLILDASGSMWGQIGGEPKIVVARRVMKDLITGLPDQTNVELLAYGHRRTGDCKDIETLVFLGPLDAEEQPIEGVEVEGGGTLQREVGFASGTLRIGARRGGELVDAAVSVRRIDRGQQVHRRQSEEPAYR